MSLKLKEIKETPIRKVLLYGDSGIGKTCFGATFPAPIYYFDFDNKISTLLSYAKTDKRVAELIEQDQIEYDVYAPRKDFSPGDAFYNKLEEFEKAANAGTLKYKTIVIDSLTTMVDEMLKHVIAMNPGINRVPTKLVKMASQQDYGILYNYLKNIVATTLNMNCNVLYTAHLDKVRDEKTGILYNQPMFPGKLARKMPIWFEEVYLAHINKNGVRCALTKANAEYTIIRSQLHNLPPEIPLRYDELVKG